MKSFVPNTPYNLQKKTSDLIFKYLQSTYTLRKEDIDVQIAHKGNLEDTSIASIFNDINENLGFTADEVQSTFITWLNAEFVLIENGVTDDMYKMHKELFEGSGTDIQGKNEKHLTPKMSSKFLVYLSKRRIQYTATIKAISKVYDEHKLIPTFYRDNDIYN